MMRRTPKFEIYRGQAGDWRWRLRAGNGRIVAQGEGHDNARDARRAAMGMQRAAGAARVVRLD